MEKETRVSQLKVVLAFAMIYLVWGSTFYAVSVALKGFPAFLLSSLRLLIAGIALAIFCVLRREIRPSVKDIIRNSICGIIIFIGGIVAVVWAQQHISSSLASTIITTPFWFIILDRQQWKFYFSSKWIPVGLVTGLLGVLLLLKFRTVAASSVESDMQIIAILTMIAGSAMWAGGSLYLKYNPTSTSTYVSTSIQLLAAGLVCIAISGFYNEPQNIVFADVALNSWIALLYLAIVSSLLGFLAFIWLIKIKPPAIVSTYSYVNPVVAVLLGWGLGREYISGIQLLALAIILSGLLFVNIPRYGRGEEQRSSSK